MALNNVPLAGQTLLATRDLIAQNFTNINNGFALDHVELGIANAGKHKAIHFTAQTNAPAAPVTGANEMSIYSAPSLFGAFLALYLKPENSGIGVDGIDFTTFGPALIGWAPLPCGLIIKWGSVTTGALAGPTLVGPIIFDNTRPFNNVYVVFLQAENNQPNPVDGLNVQVVVQSGTITVAQFFAYAGKSSGTGGIPPLRFSYFAIGI